MDGRNDREEEQGWLGKDSLEYGVDWNQKFRMMEESWRPRSNRRAG